MSLLKSLSLFILALGLSHFWVESSTANTPGIAKCNSRLAIPASRQIIVPTEEPIPAKEAGALRIMQFNVENLFETIGHHTLVEPHKYVLDNARPPQDKPEWQLQWIMEITKTLAPDFAVWEEVEDLDSMKLAQSRYGFDGYTPYLLEGNDPRGINVGMWVKNGAYDIKYESNKDVMWFDPATKKNIKVFSRDVPALIISEKGSHSPKLIILGNHSKSQRDRPNDPESTLWRTAQYKALNDLALKYRERYGPTVSIIAAGDFNADTQKSQEGQALKTNFDSAFDLAHETNAPNQIITQVYFPPGSTTPVDSQLDDIKILKGSPAQILRARVVRYRNKNGNVIPLPNSFEERNQKQPSDHLPIMTDIVLPQ